MNKYLKNNLDRWNDLTHIHEESEFYSVKEFKDGKSTLKSIELDELGNVEGKTLLHLQCHFGMDTMSWARMGATVTGVDFADKAIDLAKSLSNDLGISANFICSDIYKLPQILNYKFDIYNVLRNSDRKN